MAVLGVTVSLMPGKECYGQSTCSINAYEIKEYLKTPNNMAMCMLFGISYCLITIDLI